MRYVAVVGGEERTLVVSELSPGRYRVTLDGRELDADVQAVDEHTLSVLARNVSYTVRIESSAAGTTNAYVRGHTICAEMLDARQLRLRRAHAAVATPDGPCPVRTPMPGRVVAVLVREGQEVAAGQGLVVVEAMKMENEL